MRVWGGLWYWVGCFLALVQAGCGSSEPVISNASTVGCGAGAAQLGVGDGSLSILCGCQEAAGSIAIPPTALTCTVPQGTYVFFHYLGTVLSHQIVSNGEPSFMPGPWSQPNNRDRVQTHVVHLTVPGTYPFVDIQQGNLKGQIVVP